MTDLREQAIASMLRDYARFDIQAMCQAAHCSMPKSRESMNIAIGYFLGDPERMQEALRCVNSALDSIIQTGIIESMFFNSGLIIRKYVESETHFVH